MTGAKRGGDVGRHGIIDCCGIVAGQPFDIGTEARPSAHVQGHMHAQPARLGHRIDQMPERAFDRKAGITALGQDTGAEYRVQPFDARRQRSAPTGPPH